jgi:hypothetical protein
MVLVRLQWRWFLSAIRQVKATTIWTYRRITSLICAVMDNVMNDYNEFIREEL